MSAVSDLASMAWGALWRPDEKPSDDLPRKLIAARSVCRVATAVWLAVSLVEFVVWMLICTIGLRLVDPWWLWTMMVGGLVVGALWWITESAYRTVDPAAANSRRTP